MSQVTTFQTVQVCDNFIAQLEWLAITSLQFQDYCKATGQNSDADTRESYFCMSVGVDAYGS